MIHQHTYQCDNCGKQDRWPGDVAKSWSHVDLRAINCLAKREHVQKHMCSTACERALLLSLAGAPADAERLRAEAEEARPDLAAQLVAAKTERDAEMANARSEIGRLTAEIGDLRIALDRSETVSRKELVEAIRTALR